MNSAMTNSRMDGNLNKMSSNMNMDNNKNAQTDRKCHILSMLSQNLSIRRSAFPLSSISLTAWARGLDIRRGGSAVLYTGHMYQMIPYLKGAQKRQSAIKEVSDKMMPIARLINPFLNLTGIMSLFSANKNDIKRYNGYLRNIAVILKKCGIEFGYLYGLEDYAGTLLYDMGVYNAFERHADRVFRRLKRLGIKTVITVEPHTTEMFKKIYPMAVDGFDIEAVTYLELLEHALKSNGNIFSHINNAQKRQKKAVWVHDSCVYARHLDMDGIIASLLKKTGIEPLIPYYGGRLTHCCGGPIEALFPEKTSQIAKRRIEHFKKGENEGDNGHIPVVTACPICHLNLHEAVSDKTVVEDVSNVFINDMRIM